MQTLTIRWMKPDDCSDLKVFMDKLKNDEGLGLSTKLTEDDLKRDGFSNPPLFQCLIVEEDRIMKGYCLFCSIYDSDIGKKIYVEDIYVENKLRKNGIGKKLLDVVNQYAKEHGFAKISLASLRSNEHFYTKCGYKNITKDVGYDFYSKETSKSENELENPNINIILGI